MFTHRSIAPVLSFIALSACGMEEPFEGPGFEDGELTTRAEGPFSVVAITLDVEDHNEANAAFNEHMADMRDAIADQPGLIGSSMSLVFMSNDKYRSLSVWETEEDMLAWLESDARIGALRGLEPHLESGREVTYTIERAEMPPLWDEAERHLDERGQDAY